MDLKTPPRSIDPIHQRWIKRAYQVAESSKHPRTQCGAVIVNPYFNRSIADGYNGAPAGFPDHEVDWSPGMTWTNRDWTIHAEENAILWAGLERCVGCDIYITTIPCPRCYLRICQAKIQRVICGTGEYSKIEEDREILRAFHSWTNRPILIFKDDTLQSLF